MADAAEALPPPECGGGGESGRSSPSPCASPEFEFWMVGKNNPSAFPAPALLTADELFSGGVVRPLHNLQAPPTDGAEGSDPAALPPPPPAEAEEGEAAQPLAESGIAPTPDLPAVTFKWKDIFKAGGGEPKERKKAERRVSSVSGNAELIHINIWPFSRSRSAGATGSLSRAKPNATTVANAVAVEAAAGTTSMLRRLVPGRNNTSASGAGATGIRLGRPSPVWQLRRNKLQQTAAEQKQAGAKKKAAAPAPAPAPAPAGGASSDDKAAPAAAQSVSAPAAGCRNNAGCSEGGEEGANPPQGLFGLRTFFSKKVY